MSGSSDTRLTPDRRLAAEVLLRQFNRPGRVDHWLREGAAQLEGAEARRAWARVYGVLRHRGHLGALLGPYLRFPLVDQAVPLQVALLLGSYDLLHMDTVPDRAAVDQGVEIARALGEGRKTGLVNAVLRNVLRGEKKARLPDRAKAPLAWASTVASHPTWIVDEMAARVGATEAARWCEVNNEEPPLTLCLRDPAPSGCEDLRSQLPVRTGEHVDEALVLTERPMGGIHKLPGFEAGAFWVQDEAAQAVCRLLDLRPGMRLLDACAAPGGKTLAAVQKLGPRSLVTAVDVDETRLRLLQDSVDRVGYGNRVASRRRDLVLEPWGSCMGDTGFEAVLLDAPCSGLGVIRRHPDIRWARSEDDLARYADRQVDLLKSVAAAVVPGGTLVYAVCSFARSENEDVIERFLDSKAGGPFSIGTLKGCTPPVPESMVDGEFMRSYPHRHGTDAFFAVRLERDL